ncbi:flavin reductase family protein [Arthrobacter sp. GCM10027362]|uniref:flavin reductase family protein n=1 Tax=Arthrobacter sp. GCM10027362 TaxID=3273379 RepID=UPI003631712C
MRADFSPKDMSSRDFYKFLTSVVIPRPIAWVSSTSAGGVDNLAPHSFFTVASTKPPIVQFTPTARKDTLNNVEATGEFVVNFAAEDLFTKINDTGTNFPPGISEFDAAGLTREPSLAVRPPRVAESPVALECRLHQVIPVGNSFLVLGEVVHAAVRPDVLDGTHPDARRLKPLARMGRNEWSRLGEILEIARIPYSEWDNR